MGKQGKEITFATEKKSNKNKGIPIGGRKYQDHVKESRIHLLSFIHILQKYQANSHNT